jgi:hypothetical protein
MSKLSAAFLRRAPLSGDPHKYQHVGRGGPDRDMTPTSSTRLLAAAQREYKKAATSTGTSFWNFSGKNCVLNRSKLR